MGFNLRFEFGRLGPWVTAAAIGSAALAACACATVLNDLGRSLSLLAAALAALWLARRIACPLAAPGDGGDLPSAIWLGRDAPGAVIRRDQRFAPPADTPLAPLEVELRALRRQLAAAKAEADAAESARARFMAAAAHDLRQPFQAMNLYLQVLECIVLPSAAQVALGHLATSVRSGEELVTALLDISALEAGTVVPHASRFRLVELLDELFAEYGPVAAEKGLAFRRFVIDVEVETDRVLAKRMVRNLVHNAFRYTQRGGILVGCRRRGDRILVQICDQGQGIAADKLQKIFTEFYRLEQGDGDRSRGLGLGLTIVQRTAHLLGQEVWVSSRSGRGSIFSVTLPVAPPASLPPPDLTATI